MSDPLPSFDDDTDELEQKYAARQNQQQNRQPISIPTQSRAPHHGRSESTSSEFDVHPSIASHTLSALLEGSPSPPARSIPSKPTTPAIESSHTSTLSSKSASPLGSNRVLMFPTASRADTPLQLLDVPSRSLTPQIQQQGDEYKRPRALNINSSPPTPREAPLVLSGSNVHSTAFLPSSSTTTSATTTTAAGTGSLTTMISHIPGAESLARVVEALWDLYDKEYSRSTNERIITRASFTKMYVRMARALYEEVDTTEAMRSAHTDWERDMKSFGSASVRSKESRENRSAISGGMNLACYTRSILEVSKQWTKSAEWGGQANFLSWMYKELSGKEVGEETATSVTGTAASTPSSHQLTDFSSLLHKKHGVSTGRVQRKQTYTDTEAETRARHERRRARLADATFRVNPLAAKGQVFTHTEEHDQSMTLQSLNATGSSAAITLYTPWQPTWDEKNTEGLLAKQKDLLPSQDEPLYILRSRLESERRIARQQLTHVAEKEWRAFKSIRPQSAREHIAAGIHSDGSSVRAKHTQLELGAARSGIAASSLPVQASPTGDTHISFIPFSTPTFPIQQGASLTTRQLSNVPAPALHDVLQPAPPPQARVRPHSAATQRLKHVEGHRRFLRDMTSYRNTHATFMNALVPQDESEAARVSGPIIAFPIQSVDTAPASWDNSEPNKLATLLPVSVPPRKVSDAYAQEEQIEAEQRLLLEGDKGNKLPFNFAALPPPAPPAAGHVHSKPFSVCPSPRMLLAGSTERPLSAVEKTQVLPKPQQIVLHAAEEKEEPYALKLLSGAQATHPYLEPAKDARSKVEAAAAAAEVAAQSAAASRAQTRPTSAVHSIASSPVAAEGKSIESTPAPVASTIASHRPMSAQLATTITLLNEAEGRSSSNARRPFSALTRSPSPPASRRQSYAATPGSMLSKQRPYSAMDPAAMVSGGASSSNSAEKVPSPRANASSASASDLQPASTLSFNAVSGMKDDTFLTSLSNAEGEEDDDSASVSTTMTDRECEQGGSNNIFSDVIEPSAAARHKVEEQQLVLHATANNEEALDREPNPPPMEADPHATSGVLSTHAATLALERSILRTHPTSNRACITIPPSRPPNFSSLLRASGEGSSVLDRLANLEQTRRESTTKSWAWFERLVNPQPSEEEVKQRSLLPTASEVDLVSKKANALRSSIYNSRAKETDWLQGWQAGEAEEEKINPNAAEPTGTNQASAPSATGAASATSGTVESRTASEPATVGSIRAREIEREAAAAKRLVLYEPHPPGPGHINVGDAVIDLSLGHGQAVRSDMPYDAASATGVPPYAAANENESSMTSLSQPTEPLLMGVSHPSLHALRNAPPSEFNNPTFASAYRSQHEWNSAQLSIKYAHASGIPTSKAAKRLVNDSSSTSFAGNGNSSHASSKSVIALERSQFETEMNRLHFRPTLASDTAADALMKNVHSARTSANMAKKAGYRRAMTVRPQTARASAAAAGGPDGPYSHRYHAHNQFKGYENEVGQHQFLQTRAASIATNQSPLAAAAALAAASSLPSSEVITNVELNFAAPLAVRVRVATADENGNIFTANQKGPKNWWSRRGQVNAAAGGAGKDVKQKGLVVRPASAAPTTAPIVEIPNPTIAPTVSSSANIIRGVAAGTALEDSRQLIREVLAAANEAATATRTSLSGSNIPSNNIMPRPRSPGKKDFSVAIHHFPSSSSVPHEHMYDYTEDSETSYYEDSGSARSHSPSRPNSASSARGGGAIRKPPPGASARPASAYSVLPHSSASSSADPLQAISPSSMYSDVYAAALNQMPPAAAVVPPRLNTATVTIAGVSSHYNPAAFSSASTSSLPTSSRTNNVAHSGARLASSMSMSMAIRDEDEDDEDEEEDGSISGWKRSSNSFTAMQSKPLSPSNKTASASSASSSSSSMGMRGRSIPLSSSTAISSSTTTSRPQSAHPSSHAPPTPRGRAAAQAQQQQAQPHHHASQSVSAGNSSSNSFSRPTSASSSASTLPPRSHSPASSKHVTPLASPRGGGGGGSAGGKPSGFPLPSGANSVRAPTPPMTGRSASPSLRQNKARVPRSGENSRRASGTAPLLPPTTTVETSTAAESDAPSSNYPVEDTIVPNSVTATQEPAVEEKTVIKIPLPEIPDSVTEQDYVRA